MTFKLLSGESVIVVMDANRNRGNNVDALDWALNHVVRPKDTVIVIGILCEFGGKKSSCFPFYTGIGISAIWERLEFSGQGEMTTQVLAEEIAKKRKQYQCTLQPFYRQCNKNEVKLEVKLAAGFDPKKITIEEAQNSNTRWIVLDSHLKRHKAFIYEHAGCNVAAMKGKDLAAISLSKPSDHEALTRKPIDIGEIVIPSIQPDTEILNADFIQGDKLWASPLSCRSGFPRIFTQIEIESITNEYSNENIILMEENLHVYQGVFMEAPVLIKCFFNNDEHFWSELNILSRIRHRNISNLVGYCCTDTSKFLIRDYSSINSLNFLLQCDELAKDLSWKARLNIAQDIGSCLRYLQEDCLDGPIVPLYMSSSNISFSRGFSMMLTEFKSAKHCYGGCACEGSLSMTKPTECQSMEEDQTLSLDIRIYGLFLLELLTGRNTQSSVDWVIPLLENSYLSEIADQRLVDSSDAEEVRNIARATLICLKNDPGHHPSISEALALVRGDRFGP